MTFADLKAQLDQLSPEQLAYPAVWVGDARGGKVKELWVAAEDHIGSDMEDCMPRSDYEKNDPIAAVDADVLIKQGTPQLVVD